MELIQIYLIFLNKTTIYTNFLTFILFFFSNFSSWIQIRILNADPGGKILFLTSSGSGFFSRRLHLQLPYKSTGGFFNNIPPCLYLHVI